MNKMDGLTNEEILGRFLVRARRVEDHTLVKSGEIKHYRIPTMVLSATETGEMSVQYHVCPDEESLESLAARLRPFIVKSEPIYMQKVFDAICTQVSDDSLLENEVKALRVARDWFSHRYKEKGSKCYEIQLIGEDGQPLTRPLSDALLAEAWIYTDVVHADPKGEKAETCKLSYLDRYRAASPYFCEFASVIVKLLNLVRSLSERNLLQLPDAAWSEAVSYAEAEKNNRDQIVSTSVRVLPVGTKIPRGLIL